METRTLTRMLGWSTVINYIVLIIWFALFVGLHTWYTELHGRWFRMTPDEFDMANYVGMAIYKILVLVFNFVPFIALKIVGRKD